ncbi:hypothetical protein PanWU01x14_311080 [Parasponia andersonii]|uniref:Retroviral polymerase SH3-like domain-containing protein n=1 Tax=Parasponia andersonii TaxID=3476 RepID=A0A2P5AQ46_PARAD|nr:hypothetical protein PanWU01x14_311080 [Parasponia andersonii]
MKAFNECFPSKPMKAFNECFPSSRLPTSIPLKVFGSIAFVHNHNPKRTKLDPKVHKCIFVGYSTNQRGYKCFDPILRKMFVSMDVTFFEGQSYYHNSHLQGESSSEDVFLDGFDLSIEFTNDDSLQTQVFNESKEENANKLNFENNEQPSLLPFQNQNTDQNTETEINEKRYKGLVYSKEYQAQKKKGTILKHSQESDLRLDQDDKNDLSKIPDDNPSGNSESSNQLDLPIALRKGVRACNILCLILFLIKVYHLLIILLFHKCLVLSFPIMYRKL